MVPRPMIISDKKGSNGQKGNHNSNDDDQLKYVRAFDKNACQYRLEIDIDRPKTINELPKILLFGF